MKKFYLDEREVIALYEQYRSINKVAEHFGCNFETVRRILIKNGVQRRHKKPNGTDARFVRTPESEQLVLEAYERLGLISAVSNEICCSKSVVGNILRDHGIKSSNYTNTEKISDEDLIKECKKLTRTEIAKKYGMNVASVDKRMKRLGIHAQYVKQNGESVYKRNNGIISTEWHWMESGEKLIKQYQPEYEFIGYMSGRYKMRCRKCGNTVERARSTVISKNVQCEYCAEPMKRQREAQKLINALSNILEEKTPKTCESCGSVFYSPYATQKYCSDRCKRKRSNSSKGYRGRARKYKVPYVPGITLKAVANRDKGICQLCGKPVDWSDNTWGDSFGAMYPTIDHIVAMANGGGHTWDNVQLAHAICNSYKRDLSENEEISTAVLEGVKLMGKEAQYAEIQTA